MNYENRISVNDINYKIFLIKNKKKFKKYESELNRVTKICEPEDNNVYIDEFSVYIIMKNIETNEIISYAKLTNMKKYEDKNYFLEIGGIKNSNGIMISGFCSNINKYKNVSKPMLKIISKYCVSNNYNYIMLHCLESREHLHGSNGIYTKDGFTKSGYVSQQMSKNTLIIMHKFLI
jgi:hypothetical protein